MRQYHYHHQSLREITLGSVPALRTLIGTVAHERCILRDREASIRTCLLKECPRPTSDQLVQEVGISVSADCDRPPWLEKAIAKPSITAFRSRRW